MNYLIIHSPLPYYPMLTEKSIQQVRDASITEVISHYLKLDRSGFACCPFHNEKSASFKVTEAKGIYKCFGCGEAGDHISFVMKQDKLQFIEAVERIAQLTGIPLEYEELPDKEKYQEQKAIKDQMAEVLQFAITDYKDQLWKLPADHPVVLYLGSRGLSADIIAEWQLGWATADWKHISSDIINKNWFTPAEHLGIIKRINSPSGDGGTYDGYRSRITIPITNKYGQYIGLAGRFFEIDPADKDKKNPKYINPPQNELYDKSQVLYGLSKAIKAIEQKGFAYLVEGYFDVISMHTHGHSNSIATCGTALTIAQANLLRRYTSHAVIMRDADDAGRKAAVKDLHILLKAGFKTDIIILPDGEDPDTYIQKDETLSNVQQQDAIFWYIISLLIDADDDHFRMGKIIEQVLQLLAIIPNAIVRNNYFDSLCKKYKWKRADLQKQLNEIVEAKEEIPDDGEGRAINNLPKWMDKEHFEMHGYAAVNNKNRTGYYTHTGEKSVEITNFIITPIFHVYAGKDSRHLIQIDNGKRKAVLDIESKALVAPEILQAYVVAEGNFIIHGSKPHILRIASRLLESFPKCTEIKFLGWQQAGFFAFVDKIFVPANGLVDLDEWGVYQHPTSPSGDGRAEINFLVPAASAAYKELQQTGDDPYENDRVLTYNPSTISFSQWAAMMQRVFKEKGPVAIAYCILTIFRDIVFDIDNNCPHLYGFGERSSGKSKWAESICALFYKKRAAFNLNSGTDYAFFAYMQRFINCPASLNEFDEKIIKPEWFQSIKGAFDGESRQRGVMGSKNRTEIMKIRSTLILVGQYLCTMDDNSIVSRSIIEGFNEKEHTDDDKQQYDALKRIEEKGLSHLITEILKLRPVVKEQYREKFNATLQNWRLNTPLAETGNIRIMQNWCHLYTGWQIISQHIQLPVSNPEFEKYCLDKAMHWSRFIRSSDTLSEFWNTIAFLVDLGQVVEGWDYKIASITEIKIFKNRKEEVMQHFTEPTKVIYIRMNNVHKQYQAAYRQRTGKEGMTMENLLHYFSSRKYYIGNNKQSRFKRFVTKTENVITPGFAGAPPVQRAEVRREEEAINTSSYVFLYNELGLDIERENAENDGILQEQPQYPDPSQITEPVEDLPF